MRWFTWIFAALPAFAQDYATRAVQPIIPSPPQGNTDLTARALLAKLGIQRQ